MSLALSVLFIVFAFSGSCATVLRVNCAGMIFKDTYYDKVLLVGNLGKPNNLIYHAPSNLLFFSHTIQTDKGIDFKISWCHLKTRVCKDVKEVMGGYAIAIDRTYNLVYMGGHRGIYKFNFETKEAELFGAPGVSIWGLFYKRYLYYIEYPSQKLFFYDNKKFHPVVIPSGEVDYFFINEYGNIYFSNKTALFKISKPDVLVHVHVINENLSIRQITDNLAGEVHFCASDGIYTENTDDSGLTRRAHIENAFGLTFDEHNNPIFSTTNNIYRLVNSKISRQCLQALKAYNADEEAEFFVATPGDGFD